MAESSGFATRVTSTAGDDAAILRDYILLKARQAIGLKDIVARSTGYGMKILLTNLSPAWDERALHNNVKALTQELQGMFGDDAQFVANFYHLESKEDPSHLRIEFSNPTNPTALLDKVRQKDAATLDAVIAARAKNVGTPG